MRWGQFVSLLIQSGPKTQGKSGRKKKDAEGNRILNRKWYGTEEKYEWRIFFVVHLKLPQVPNIPKNKYFLANFWNIENVHSAHIERKRECLHIMNSKRFFKVKLPLLVTFPHTQPHTQTHCRRDYMMAYRLGWAW